MTSVTELACTGEAARTGPGADLRRAAHQLKQKPTHTPTRLKTIENWMISTKGGPATSGRSSRLKSSRSRTAQSPLDCVLGLTTHWHSQGAATISGPRNTPRTSFTNA